MQPRDGYLAGVPCWVDIMQRDVDATMAFYGDLFGWTFDVVTPEGEPSRYAYARLDGLLVGGVGGPPAENEPGAGWTTYVWVDAADDTSAQVAANGGRVLVPPTEIPGAGRMALCVDPSGATFGLWQASGNRGAELVNAPGSWVFSQLDTPDAGAAVDFYGAVFGWVGDPFDRSGGDPSMMLKVEGYGEFLAERDPEIRERQATEQAPPGFADVVALLQPSAGGGPASWGVTFAVDDADKAFRRATELGASVVTPLFDTAYTRMGTVEDPQGAVITLSEYRPPSER